MKVTFVVYDHQNNSISLVKSEVKGNKPKEAEWERAAKEAKDKIAQIGDKKLSAWVGKKYRGTYSISSVLKGWVDFEDRAPVDWG
jgi:chromosome condensin MukBEF complex kleisin-like MukF subunit